VADYKLWQLDKAKTANAVLTQADFEPIGSEFGANDFAIDFLREQGLWQTLVNSRALGLKKGNGKNIELLNGVMVVKELAGIKCIANAKKLLADGNLMTAIGFNLEEIQEKDAAGQGVICRNTLRNHSDRIPMIESYRSFYEHVKYLRQKKWLRGGIYAVDGYEIEITIDPTNTEYEDAGVVWCDRELRWKYGYKLLLLANIAEGRERIVGAYLDRIEVNEIKILKKMICHIEKYVCPLGDMVKEIVMDRGFWSEELIRWFKEKKGVEVKTLAKKNLCIVKDDVKDLIKLDKLKFESYQIKNKQYYQRTTDWKLKKPSREPEYLDLELAVERNLDFKVFKDGYLDVVIRREQKERTFLITLI